MADSEVTGGASGRPSELSMLPTVFVPMAADIVHAGHINILNVSRQHGRVIVGLMSDQGLQSYKRTPILSYDQRVAVVRSFSQVDEIIQLDGKDYSGPLMRIKPNFMVHGSDWSDPSSPQFHSRKMAIQLMATWGGQVIEPEYTRGISTTDIIKSCADYHCSANRKTCNRDDASETSQVSCRCLSGRLQCFRLMLGVAPAVLLHQRNLALGLHLASHVLGRLTGNNARHQNSRLDRIFDRTVGLASGVAFTLGLCLPPAAPPALAAPCCAVLSLEVARSMLAVDADTVEKAGKRGSSKGCWTAFETICSVAQQVLLSSVWCWAADPRNTWLGCIAASAPFASWKLWTSCAEVGTLLHA